MWLTHGLDAEKTKQVIVLVQTWLTQLFGQMALWFSSLPSLGHSGNMQQWQVNLCKHLFLPCSKNKSLTDCSECRPQTVETPLFCVGQGPIPGEGTVPPRVELCVLASFGIGKYIINYSQYSTSSFICQQRWTIFPLFVGIVLFVPTLSKEKKKVQERDRNDTD